MIDSLQTKFGARCRAWNVAQFNQEAPPSIRLRLDDELNVPASITNDYIIKDKKEILRYAHAHLSNLPYIPEFELNLILKN